MSQSMQEAAALAAHLIRASGYTVALTGAGVSTPSGIPDFRSANTGLWTRNNPMEVASLSAFRNQPDKFFHWLLPLVREMSNAQPNPAHLALARLERDGYLKAVITQNIDGLHQRAGTQNLCEVHGSLNALTCLKCRQNYPARDFLDSFIHHQKIPQCKACRSALKPDIVLFEEMLPMDVWNAAQAHAEKADLFVVIGSALEVTPAAHLPLYALENGAKLIIITLSPTYLDPRAALLLPFDVAKVLPAIVGCLNRG
ncbi:MAG: NAD-dependent deacylase [Chloroflexota bacterium]